MGKGCLWLAASLLFFGAWLVGLILFIAFGPRSIIAGELFGIGYVSLTAALLARRPHLATALRGRNGSLAEHMAEAASRDADPPGSAGLAVSRFVGWVLVAVMGSITLLVTVVAYGLWLEGDRDSGMTGAAVMSGMGIALTYLFWNLIPKSGPSA